MEVKKFDIEGPLFIQLDTFHDNRGLFVERFNEAKFDKLGLPTKFLQDNFSRSHFGVLRGLHCQYNPSMGKLVSCTRGEIYDVAVDIRKNSPTYGKYISATLKGDYPALLWIPEGFAHGFCVTSKEGADVLYKVDAAWSPNGEICIRWNDPDLGIAWPIENVIISSKDQVGTSFRDFKPI